MKRVLVANRGEIALRVFRAAHGLDLAAVAVAAPDDLGSLHARSADALVEIPSYLDPAALVAAAVASGADAIHPGYGFLAENGDFAESVVAAGLVWIGPPAAALRAGGDKLAARALAASAGVPTIPETEVPPLIVKAAAGGGGRGMRVVRSRAELAPALEAAKREALAAFGDDRVYLERYLERPRHVEVQLLADTHGAVISLGERDCSIQRRHQKLLEESPAVGLPADLRSALAEAAVAFGRLIGYQGAGTVEFVVDGDDFFFLELNGRIQVEHPVTELVTGIDLVEWQLRIARGEHLDIAPEARGHAIEARLYAEDPVTFLPQAGRLDRLRLPSAIRVDAGVEEGDEVGTSYDPLLAKLIAVGPTRREALARLAGALAETEVAGVTTNLPLLRWLVAQPGVRAGAVTTAFLVEHPPLSVAPPLPPAAVWQGPFRLNLPPPRPQAPPRLSSVERTADGAWHLVTAPMPGTVVKVHVEPGATVAAGAPLVVLEAMKMETPLMAPRDAVVRAVHARAGDRVVGGALLVELEAG